jgi:hypothetical protein
LERKAIMKKLTVFSGKEKVYSEKLLTLLYDNEPLTAWELAAKIRRTGRQSLHATLSKRLRELEKKDYVKRTQTKWFLTLKGILAVLLIQKKPKPWNPKWTETYAEVVDGVEDAILPSMERYGLEKKHIHEAAKKLNLTLDDFDAWVELSNKAKEFMENGVINLDVIKQETLFGVLMLETKTMQQLSNIWEPETKESSPDKSSET